MTEEINEKEIAMQLTMMKEMSAYDALWEADPEALSDYNIKASEIVCLMKGCNSTPEFVAKLLKVAWIRGAKYQSQQTGMN